jgi:hypothetical protein
MIAWAEDDFKVKGREIFGPPCLPLVQPLQSHEVLQVHVIGESFNQVC